MPIPNLSTPGVIIIDLLSSLPREVYLVVAVLFLLLMASFLLPSWLGTRVSSASHLRQLSDINFEPRSVMTPNEALAYNALHMVVRNQFLLLAKVPLRQLIRMNETDVRSRRALWFLTKNVLVDFVLLHPGSLVPEKVIFLSSDDGESFPSHMPDASVLNLLGLARIGVAQISAQKSYSVEELRDILELGEEE